MSKVKSHQYKDDGVRFDKATGDAYVDRREVIEDELRRIKARRERANQSRSQRSSSTIRNNDKQRNASNGETS